MKKLDDALTAGLPTIAGDEIIQIGTVLYKNGKAVSKHIWVLGTVNEAGVKPPGAEVPISAYSFADEANMVKDWFRWIARMRIDVLIGYNIFGFDSKYIHDRMVELVGAAGAKIVFDPLSCLRSRPPRLEEKFLSSSAMGDNTMYFLSSPGRLQIDLLPYIRRNANLDSYTLDNVSATYVSGGISGALVPVEGGSSELFRFATKSTKGTVVGRYITLMDDENDRVVDRCEVVGVEPKALTVKIVGGSETLAENGGIPVRWAQVKDDVSPKDIFRLHRGSADDRAIVARYCLQDCDLVMELLNKLEVLNNSVAMADVCSVPVSFIFTRGQGIKIESLIFKECRKVDQLIEVLPSSSRDEPPEGAVATEEDEEEEEEDSYEGAIVLEPHTGIYIDDPVTADDFASLYPSSIISENISHDTLIWVKDYDNDGNFLCLREGSDKYDNLAGAKYVNVEFDILRSDPEDKRKHPAKIRDGRRVARYIQSPQGTIPRILDMLLMNRKRVRKIAETEPDEFRRALLDAQQLAYKLTANSLYGQLGSGTFKIRRQVLAASTTGYGRKQLMYAKAVIEAVYGGGKDPRCDVECVYGDTDSIFLRFRPRDPATGERLKGKEALRVAKDLTVESGKLVSSCLKAPHDFEFDKIFKSFILLSKKRYVGDMSEDGIEDEDFHRKSMGIVMKRRDNAPIVKYVYGNVVEKILNATDVPTSIKEATEFVQKSCRDLLAGKFPLSKLTITKSLRANYADPTRIAHKVLADRIGERDPGNKPSTSDRIPYVYISHGSGPAPKLQGDRIELPSYIKEKGLTPDYAFYITNQIAKPLSQVFGLAVENMPGVTVTAINKTAKAVKPVKEREKLAESLLFEKVLLDAARRPEVMESRGQKSIAAMFATAASNVRR
jgi:DNA polymerase elongation subunit (family B)